MAVRGAALVPNVDEPGSTVAGEFGPISRGFSFLFNKVAGGHHKVAHLLLGLGIVMRVLGPSVAGPEGLAILSGLLAGGA